MNKPGGLESAAAMVLRFEREGRAAVQAALSPAWRLELVAELLAPRDENGVPHPEHALIDAETARRILERGP